MTGEVGPRLIECARRDEERLCLRRRRGAAWTSGWVVWCFRCADGASGSSANLVNLAVANGLEASVAGEWILGVANRLCRTVRICPHGFW